MVTARAPLAQPESTAGRKERINKDDPAKGAAEAVSTNGTEGAGEKSPRAQPTAGWDGGEGRSAVPLG